jgi:hypothetical protein
VLHGQIADQAQCFPASFPTIPCSRLREIRR